MRTFMASVDQSKHRENEPTGVPKILVWFGGNEYQWLTKKQVKYVSSGYKEDWKNVWAEGIKNRLLADLSRMGWLSGVIQDFKYTDDAMTAITLTVQLNAEFKEVE